MKPKLAFRCVIDICMTAGLLLLMAYEMIGAATHEWIGIVMLVLFIIHHIFNANWLKNTFRGKYTPFRIVQTVLAILVLISMLGSMVSGIILSRHALRFLNISAGRGIARTVHMVCAYWGFILMSLHIGIHLNIAYALLKRKDKSGKLTLVFRIVPAVISAYGIYAFVKRNIGEYLFLSSQFVFFDMSEPVAFFLIDYLSIMCLFAVVGYGISSIAKIAVSKKHNQ